MIRFTRTGGPAMLRMMGGQPDPADAPSGHAQHGTPEAPTGHAQHGTPEAPTGHAHHDTHGTHHGMPGADAGPSTD